ncbi:ileal sodium/bile acid cotransporter-like isoform X2 [Ornithodoros turicata]|uniref:ileal sodium/bile acid cotransporter-like isoform X2 n=1 Tax=Ornithodoros turicata TaxID=34597 RepID=UPI003139B56B
MSYQGHGAFVTKEHAHVQLWHHLKRPMSILVGMLSQFILLPLISFALLSVLKLDGLYAVGMLILSCSPGGATSNIFAYFCDGDVPLSIVMTVSSTILAMAMMPLNILFYGQFIDTGSVVVPYVKIATSLFIVSIPACFGMLFNWKFPRPAPYITKAGSILGFLLIVTAQTMEVFIFPDIFRSAPRSLYLAVALLPAAGMLVGYAFSWVLGRPDPVRRTIAIESGVQNIGTAITVIALSFTFELQKAALTFPLLYGISMVIFCFVVSSIYNIVKRLCSKCKDEAVFADTPTIDQSSSDLKEIFKKNTSHADEEKGTGKYNPSFGNVELEADNQGCQNGKAQAC